MSLLNVNIGILAYRDKLANVQPLIRLADIKWSLFGLNTNNFNNTPIALAPGETMTVVSTARNLTFSGAAIPVTVSGSQMILTGSFGQTVSRSSGDATTQWVVTQNTDSVMIQAVGGTLPDFTTVQAGDIITLGTTFNTYNQGDFTIWAVGSNYVQIKNALGISEMQTAQVQIYSNGPLQMGDILDITNSGFASCNRGAFGVTRVNPNFIQILNPNAISQTVASVSSGIEAYPFAYKWCALAVDQRVIVGLNGASPSVIEVEPPFEGDLDNSPGIFMKRGKVFEIQITNPGLTQANGFVILAD